MNAEQQQRVDKVLIAEHGASEEGGEIGLWQVKQLDQSFNGTTKATSVNLFLFFLLFIDSL